MLRVQSVALSGEMAVGRIEPNSAVGENSYLGLDGLG